ncbi:hypothetical protein FHH43_08350 [Clostridium perfringens]|nr:hypothetical protein [Clostridium perfringens]
MDNENIKLLWMSLGAFMLVLLQTDMFQNAIAFVNRAWIPLIGDICFYLSELLSFIVVVIFVITSLKLIRYNIK